MSAPTGADYSAFAQTQTPNTLDSNAMPSSQAEAARQKSSQVMAALKSNDPSSADKLMGARTKSKEGGAFDKLKRMFSTRNKTKANPSVTAGLDDSASTAPTESTVDSAQLTKDGGKGDGVIR